MVTQLTSEQAIELSKTEWWKTKTDYEVALFQLQQKCLCMPFSDFHGAVEKALGRPVFTHEFGSDGLLEELLGGSDRNWRKRYRHHSCIGKLEVQDPLIPAIDKESEHT